MDKEQIEEEILKEIQASEYFEDMAKQDTFDTPAQMDVGEPIDIQEQDAHEEISDDAVHAVKEEEVELHPNPEINKIDEAVVPEQTTIPKEEIKKRPEKELLTQMRALLTDYPLKIDFTMGNNLPDLIHNFFLIVNILNYCKNKSNNQDIRDAIDKELNVLKEKIDIIQMTQLYMDYNKTQHSSISYGKSLILTQMKVLMQPHLPYILEKVQYFILAIPTKGKAQMHFKTAMGLPAYNSEELEGGEIEEGKNIVNPNDVWKINEEGKVISAE